MKNVLYHYTTELHLEKILDSGYLKVSDFEIKNKVKRPALWLSKNPTWEKTATKNVYDPNLGTTRPLTFEEQSIKFGCVRLTVPFCSTFCTWAKYRHVSKEPTQICDSLERIGIQQGSKPSDWYASFSNIPISKIESIEIWDGNEWVDYFES
jgi:hypothetical protein